MQSFGMQFIGHAMFAEVVSTSTCLWKFAYFVVRQTHFMVCEFIRKMATVSEWTSEIVVADSQLVRNSIRGQILINYKLVTRHVSCYHRRAPQTFGLRSWAWSNEWLAVGRWWLTHSCASHAKENSPNPSLERISVFVFLAVIRQSDEQTFEWKISEMKILVFRWDDVVSVVLDLFSIAMSDDVRSRESIQDPQLKCVLCVTGANSANTWTAATVHIEWHASQRGPIYIFLCSFMYDVCHSSSVIISNYNIFVHSRLKHPCGPLCFAF